MASIPVPYIGTGAQSQIVLGHYATAQKSGATVSIGALGHIWRIRWAPSISAAYLVCMRLKAGWSVISAITAATPMDFDFSVARAMTVDYTTAITNCNLSTPVGTGCMRKNMSNSQMGTAGPGICTTAVISGQTLTLDANPFAYMVWANQPSGNATVTQAIGVAGDYRTVYEWTGLGQHPVVCSNLEGIVGRQVTAGTTSGTMSLAVGAEWAEALAF